MNEYLNLLCHSQPQCVKRYIPGESLPSSAEISLSRVTLKLEQIVIDRLISMHRPQISTVALMQAREILQAADYWWNRWLFPGRRLRLLKLARHLEQRWNTGVRYTAEGALAYTCQEFVDMLPEIVSVATKRAAQEVDLEVMVDYVPWRGNETIKLSIKGWTYLVPAECLGGKR